MNRRQFLKESAACGAILALGNFLSCTQNKRPALADPGVFESLRIIDTHAHPDQFYAWKPGKIDRSSTVNQMKELGMEASVFAALGDHVSRGRIKGSVSEFRVTLFQLRRVRLAVAKGEVKLVLKASDVPRKLMSGDVPGAILTIEGGEALEGLGENVDRLYKVGVRLITLIHQRPNGLGDSINVPPEHGGLTPAGREMVDKIQDRGILVDVAHAYLSTLKDIVQVSQAPLVESHTGLARPGRFRQWFRPWEEMELVAKTGGVVCTWPWKIPGRETFHDWAKEILKMKERLGMDHVGLGTDGGGNLPELINGYRDIRDLVHLVAAMLDVGLSHVDVEKYMGGNFYRVFEQCVG